MLVPKRNNYSLWILDSLYHVCIISFQISVCARPFLSVSLPRVKGHALLISAVSASSLRLVDACSPYAIRPEVLSYAYIRYSSCDVMKFCSSESLFCTCPGLLLNILDIINAQALRFVMLVNHRPNHVFM